MKKFFIAGILCTLVLSSCNSSSKKEAATSSESLTIIATLTAQPEYKDELLKAIEAVVKSTRQEAGNISYNVFEDVNNPLQWTFIETWKSQNAIDSHNNSEHFKAFAKTVEGKSSLSVFILKPKL